MRATSIFWGIIFCDNLPRERQTIIEALKQQMVSSLVVPSIRFVSEVLTTQSDVLARPWQLQVPATAFIPSNDALVDYEVFAAKWGQLDAPYADKLPQRVDLECHHRVFVQKDGQLDNNAFDQLCSWLERLDTVATESPA